MRSRSRAERFSEVREALLGRVRETLDRMPVGVGLPVARLCALAMDREEVTNCRVLLPAADLAAGPAQVLRAGSSPSRGWEGKRWGSFPGWPRPASTT